MKIQNTLTQNLDEFEPINGKKVNIFVCGPTVYDYAHIGNGKTFTQFDFIVKYLRYRGFDVFYLSNITDIDDKIIRKAQELGVSWEEVSKQYADIFLADMKALGNDAVSEYARATDHIDAIVNQVKRLEEKGFAYRTSDGIYFEISKFRDYGKLSRRTEIKETDGVSRIDASTEKRGWNDFCLWKFSKPGEPTWKTDLGEGRPGWHIEDTAITETFFGPQYDIHGGASDLVFPHHEAEIAQMEAASGKVPLVKYWMHVGFLNMQSSKMSKSLGNFLTIRGVLENYNFRVIRFLFISGHYRSTLEYNDEVLQQAKNGLKRIDEFVFNTKPEYKNENEKELVAKLRIDMNDAMDNDFDTPKAFSILFNYIKDRNSQGDYGYYTLEYLKELNTIFGFMEFSDNSDSLIENLIKERDEFRKNKDFANADRIKNELLASNVQLYDTPEGTKWRKLV